MSRGLLGRDLGRKLSYLFYEVRSLFRSGVGFMIEILVSAMGDKTCFRIKSKVRS